MTHLATVVLGAGAASLATGPIHSYGVGLGWLEAGGRPQRLLGMVCPQQDSTVRDASSLETGQLELL